MISGAWYDLDMAEYWVPSGIGVSEHVDRKSRFLGEARAVADPNEARRRVKELKEEHSGARHVAWAHVIGSSGALLGLSDDGEPHGTAGRPILDPIVGAGLTNTLVTVVRYFGGVKLGTGGLVSAYGRSAREALEAMPRRKLIPMSDAAFEVVYSDYEPVVRLVRGFDGELLKEEFAASVSLEVRLPSASLDAFSKQLSDLTRGAVHLRGSD